MSSTLDSCKLGHDSGHSAVGGAGGAGGAESARTSIRPKRVHFAEDTKEFDGTSEYNRCFEEMIVGFLQGRITLKDIEESIIDHLMLSHFNDLIHDLIVRVAGYKDRHYPILPHGGGYGYKISYNHLHPWVMNIHELFKKMLNNAYSEAFSEETEMYYNGVGEIAELEEFLHIPSSLHFDPETVFSE